MKHGTAIAGLIVPARRGLDAGNESGTLGNESDGVFFGGILQRKIGSRSRERLESLPMNIPRGPLPVLSVIEVK